MLGDAAMRTPLLASGLLLQLLPLLEGAAGSEAATNVKALQASL
jgi:hypothetical protein